LYLGLQEKRCGDEEYFELMDEFLDAVYQRWPNVLVQFEDFQNEPAVALLKKYRDDRLCFNDDIQGTGAVTVAGIMSALRAKGLHFKDIIHERFVVVGAGSAGIGVANSIVMCMLKYGITEKDARSRFWFVDNVGLLTNARAAPAANAKLLPGQNSFLQPESSTLMEGSSLLHVIKTVKPTVLLGLSGAGTDHVSFPFLFCSLHTIDF